MWRDKNDTMFLKTTKTSFKIAKNMKFFTCSMMNNEDEAGQINKREMQKSKMKR